MRPTRLLRQYNLGRPFRIVYLGEGQEGFVGLLALIAHGEQVRGVVTHHDGVKQLAERLGLPLAEDVVKLDWDVAADPIFDPTFATDLLICMPNTQTMPPLVVRSTNYGVVTIEVAVIADDLRANVQKITARENGRVVTEVKVDVSGCDTFADIRDKLSAYFVSVLWDVIEALK